MYLIYQAPDLALTQLMFELISVVLFLLVLRLLPEEEPKTADVWRRGRVALATVVGVALGWTTLHAGTTADLFHVEHRRGVLAQAEGAPVEASMLPIAGGGAHTEDASARQYTPTGRLGDWFLAHSYKGSEGTDGRGGGGNNVVNVILVDFRGYDTMGEITVLTIALIGVLSMLAATPAARSAIAKGALSVGSGSAPIGGQPHLRSSLLRTAMGLILPLSLAYAGYVFFKGHNEPGGGFIAGLIASVGFAVYRMAEGAAGLRRVVPVHPGVLAGVGLSFALVTGFLPVLVGAAALDGALPLFYSVQMYIPRLGATPFHLPSVAFFDFGVFLVVVGVSVGMLNRFEEELDS
jgi:multisubunit Na+/H+ antiporter MnhB subunit